MGIKNYANFMHCSFETKSNAHLNLLHVGWEKCKPNYTFVNQRNIYLIHYVKSGKGTLQTRNKKSFLSAGCAFLIRPNQLATYTADANEPWEYYYFAFDGTLSEEMISKSCFKDDDIHTIIKNDTFSKKIQNAMLEFESIRENSFLSLKYLFDLFYFFSPLSQEEKIDIDSKKTQYISIMEEFIMFNYSKPIKISELSEMIGLNRSHLLRTFKKHTGKSIEEFIIHVRIQEAKRYLRETDYCITDISEYVGYNNYPSFFRMFKKLVGVTPTEYRDQHSELPPPQKNSQRKAK